MAKSVFALPVSLEQLAVVIRHMSPQDRQRLLTLVPELREAAIQGPSRTRDEARASAEQIRAEVAEALAGQVLSPDEPFMDDLTLGQYLDLPDAERDRLWKAWADIRLDSTEERDARANAMPAR